MAKTTMPAAEHGELARVLVDVDAWAHQSALKLAEHYSPSSKGVGLANRLADAATQLRAEMNGRFASEGHGATPYYPHVGELANAKAAADLQ